MLKWKILSEAKVSKWFNNNNALNIRLVAILLFHPTFDVDWKHTFWILSLRRRCNCCFFSRFPNIYHFLIFYLYAIFIYCTIFSLYKLFFHELYKDAMTNMHIVTDIAQSLAIISSLNTECMKWRKSDAVTNYYSLLISMFNRAR